MDPRTQAGEALQYAQERRFAKALPLLRALVRQTHVADSEYDPWLEALARSLRALDQSQAAGFVYLYLHRPGEAAAAFEHAKRGAIYGWCLALLGRHQEAAVQFDQADLPAHAAVALEEAGELERAAMLWERLRDQLVAADDLYPRALALVGSANARERASAHDPNVHRHRAQALSLLEALADTREAEGEFDAAIDCYHIMIGVGQQQGAFENISEGYINIIRILREQGRLHTALRYYAGIGALGEELGELHAVASLWREAAAALKRSGAPHGSFYALRAADAWRSVAQAYVASGAPAELAENAWLAALDGYNQLDMAGSVTECYEGLAALPVSHTRVARYRALARGSAHESRAPETIQAPGRILLTPARIPPLHRDDILDWEFGDAPITILGTAVWELRYHDTVRRKALLLLLDVLDGFPTIADIEGLASAPELRDAVIQLLGYLHPKRVLRSLRALARARQPAVRCAAMGAAGQLQHVQGLHLVSQGLRDPDAAVRRAAAQALGKHDRPELFEALRRVLEGLPEGEARKEIVQAMSKMRTFETAEFFYRALLMDTVPEARNALRRGLEAVLNAEWRAILEQRAALEPEALRPRVAFLVG